MRCTQNTNFTVLKGIVQPFELGGETTNSGLGQAGIGYNRMSTIIL